VNWPTIWALSIITITWALLAFLLKNIWAI